MDLIPGPDQVVAAAVNLATLLRRGRLADVAPMRRTVLTDRGPGTVHRYRPLPGVASHGDPVLLVGPLGAPALCYDLRRGCSLVEHLLEGGRPTYLVELDGRPDGTALERLVDDVLPTAVTEVARDTAGHGVHLVGWGPGGLAAVLAAASRPDLPLVSLTSLAAPFDVDQVSDVAPLRPFPRVAGGRAGLMSHAHRLLGGARVPLLGRVGRLPAVDSLLTKPLTLAWTLDDADFLAQVEAVDRLRARTAPDHRGRRFGRLYHRVLAAASAVEGSVTIDGGREIRLDGLRVPLLVVAGAGDTIAPAASVRRLLALLPAGADARFEVVEGGHLGMLTGRRARGTTWPLVERWLDAGCAATGDAVAPPGRAASAPAIGSNPRRRYASAASRTLAGA
ncbi:MAG: alpha/beta hydrolase [Nocardioidaceae bacterium]